MAKGLDIPPNSGHTELVHFTEPMDNFNDFVDLQAEIFDWEDDILIPTEDVDEESFRQFVNSNFDF